MKQLVSLVSLALCGLSAYAVSTSAMDVAHFNSGWPNAGEAIANMTSISSITSAGPYSFAIGTDASNNIDVAFYNGSQWQSAVNIPNLKGVSSIVPLYINGANATAFAESANGLLSFFNGIQWGPAQSISGMQNISLLGSAGHMFAISNAPTQSSFFNIGQQTWGAPVNLTNLSTVRAGSAANGEVYVVGLNANGNLTEMQSSNNQDWTAQNFNMVRPYLIETVASNSDILIGAQNSDQSQMDYSTDQGRSWQSIDWPGGLLFNTVNQGVAWDMDEQSLAYLDLESNHPAWMTVAIPETVGRVQTYSNPSADGMQLCVVGEEEDNPIQLACYTKGGINWQMISSVNQVASRLDQIRLLNQNEIIAMGADTKGLPALFYYNGETWQVAHVQGLTGSVQNLYMGNSSANVWATGHN